MKKFISILTALALTLSLTVTAFATEIDQDDTDKTGSTAVTLNVDPSYTITIPATVELTAQGNDPETYENDLDITANANVRLPEGKVITVTMKSDFTMKDTNGGNSELVYTVTVGGTDISTGGTVATFTTSTAAQTSTLHFAADNPAYAGDYSDTVTFTIAIVDAA